jgi:quinoprotein glucose dehydrogenase
LWKPHFDGQAAYIVPPLANICDGPSGLCYEPGTALTPKWRQHFFVCDFRGDRASSGIQTFTLKPKGASFELDTFEHFIWGTLATDCDFGPDGNFYWTDWVEGWGKTGKGRIYRLASTDAAARSLSRNTAALIASDWSKSESERLLELLDYPDLRVRQAAHLELSRRDSDNLGLRFAFAGFPKGTRTLQHFAWSVAARHDADEFRRWLPPGLGDGGIAMLPQGARMIGDFGLHEYDRELIAAIGSEEPVARSQAAISAGKLHLAPALGVLVELARTTGESDPTLRHAAIFGLAGCATAEQLVAMKSDASVDVRVAAVVALRRQKREQVAEFLKDTDERVVVEATRAIYDVPIEAAYPQLANLIEQKPLASTALVRRVLHANFRLGGEDRADKLAQFATRADADELHRWEALDLLSKWAEPPGRDGLTGEWWPLAKREAGFLPRLVNDMHERGIADAPTRVLVAWIELAASCGARDEAPHLAALASDTQRDVKVRVAALKAATKLDVHVLEPALGDLALDTEPRVRAATLNAIQLLSPAKALPLLEQAARQGSCDERRVAYAALAKLDEPQVDALFAAELDKLRASLVPVEVALDLIEAAEQRKSDAVKRALEALREPRKIDASLAPFVDSLYGGERERGRKVFREKAETTCLRCHRIEWNEGGQVGPDLNGVGKRLSRVELLESIADPNRRIARGYGAIVLTLDDDTHVAGIVVSESAERVKLRTAQDELVEVETRRIAGRRADLSAMPQNVSSFLSRDEMRDLIEYLAGL